MKEVRLCDDIVYRATRSLSLLYTEYTIHTQQRNQGVQALAKSVLGNIAEACLLALQCVHSTCLVRTCFMRFKKLLMVLSVTALRMCATK